MKVPCEIGLSTAPCQPAVPCVLVLEPSKESLGGIGCGWDTWPFDELKHVGQRLDEHRSRGSEIALHPLTPVRGEHVCSIVAIPGTPISEESSSVRIGAYLQHTPEQGAQSLRIDALGMGAAPALALPLDVQQAALNHNVRPRRAEHALELRVAVDGGRDRAQTSTLQLATHLQHRPFAFFDAKESRDHGIRRSVDEHHDSNPTTIQKGAVHDDMPMPRQIPVFGGRVIEPIPDHLTHLPRTQTALLAQLTNRVSMADPTREPHAPTRPACGRRRRNEAVSTTQASPTLTTRSRGTIATGRQLVATRAPLFGSFCSIRLTKFAATAQTPTTSNEKNTTKTTLGPLRGAKRRSNPF